MEDKTQIQKHGGVAKLARLLGYSVQRVNNWLTRGIPPKERVLHPDLFPIPTTRKQKRTKPQEEKT